MAENWANGLTGSSTVGGFACSCSLLEAGKAMPEYTVTRETLNIVEDPHKLMTTLFWKRFEPLLKESWDIVKIMILPVQSKRSFSGRQKLLDSATEKLLETLRKHPGVTEKGVRTVFKGDHGFSCTTYGNKLRKLRKEGLATSVVGNKKLLRWFAVDA